MKKNLTIGILQYDIAWENIPANLELIESFLSSQKILPEIIVLPEMFTTGFCMSPLNLNKQFLHEQIYKLSKLSKDYAVNIMGSLVVHENNKFYNRFFHFKPDNSPSYYNKRHLFSIGTENEIFVKGKQRIIFNLDDIKIFPQICYDLRFPVWSRNNLDYHILINVANWPSKRQNVWNTLLAARAIENQCYVVGVNRIGKDENNIEYIGGSKVLDPKGTELLNCGNKKDYKEIILDIQSLLKFKEEFPVYKDNDNFVIKNRD